MVLNGTLVTAMIHTTVMSRNNHEDNGGGGKKKRSILSMANHPMREGRDGQMRVVPPPAVVGELRRTSEFRC